VPFLLAYWIPTFVGMTAYGGNSDWRRRFRSLELLGFVSLNPAIWVLIKRMRSIVKFNPPAACDNQHASGV
jgi:hypothetical protein